VKTTRRHPMQKVIEDIAQRAGRLDEYRQALKDGYGFHIRLESGAYMPLSIEVIAPRQVSVCHYGEQNGDLMRDPEMIFEYAGPGFLPVYYRNDYIGIERTMVRRDDAGRIMRYTLDSFPATWARNIRHQGFVDAAGKPNQKAEAVQ